MRGGRKKRSESSDEEPISEEEDDEDLFEFPQAEETAEVVAKEVDATAEAEERPPVFCPWVEIPPGDLSPLALPDSSADLSLEGGRLVDALEIYEFCRSFYSQLELSPFSLEDLCGALQTAENSRLLGEIHVRLLRFVLRDEEKRQTWFEPPDAGVFSALLGHLLDGMNYAEVLRLYATSDPSDRLESKEVVGILSNSAYPFVPTADRLLVLQWLVGRALQSKQLESFLGDDEPRAWDDKNCRSCGKSGTFVCCDCCDACYHLKCAKLREVPKNEWLCGVCSAHSRQSRLDWKQLATADGRGGSKGANRWASIGTAGSSGSLPIAYLCSHDSQEQTLHYYSTVPQLYELLQQLDPGHLERELCERMAERVDELAAGMKATVKATIHERDVWRKSRKMDNELGDLTYFEMDNFCRFPAVFDHVRANTNGETPELLKKLHKHLGFLKNELLFPFWTGGIKEVHLLSASFRAATETRAEEFRRNFGHSFRSGVSDRSFRSYSNLFADSPLAKPWKQRQQEADRQRRAAQKFGWTKETLVKWTPEKRMFGEEADAARVIRESIRQFVHAIPDGLKHRLWAENRAEFFEKLDAAGSPQQLGEMLVLAERVVRKCALHRNWSEALGAVRLHRRTLEERSEGFTKRREEEVGDVHFLNILKNRSFIQSLARLPGESFRVSNRGGMGGWRWTSVSYKQRLQPAEQPTIEEIQDLEMIEEETPPAIQKAANLERLVRKLAVWRGPTERRQLDAKLSCVSPVCRLTLTPFHFFPVENEQPDFKCYARACPWRAYVPNTAAVVRVLKDGQPAKVQPVEPPLQLRKSVKGEGLPFEFPHTAGFRAGANSRPNFFSLPPASLRRAARRGGLTDGGFQLPGFAVPSKERPAVWSFPTNRPQFDHCWRFTALTSRSLQAVALNFRLLHSFVRWDELKPPAGSDGRFVTHHRAYDERRTVVSHKEYAPDGSRVVYKVEIQVLSAEEGGQTDDEDTNDSRDSPVGRPRRLGTRQATKGDLRRPAQRIQSTHQVLMPAADLKPYEIAKYWRRYERAIQQQQLQNRVQPADEKRAKRAAQSFTQSEVNGEPTAKRSSRRAPDYREDKDDSWEQYIQR
ncbi:hypothetical protein M3Y99_00748700 [Aphelenchoides fujianensis]|nr:hypothetical protein M3Y99_00748700 [Aphelenchoides fujianensis]